MKVYGSKKTLFALERARADIARHRRRWKTWQDRLDPHRLVFIDETWIRTNMAPLRGWGPKGKRLHGFAPHGRWRTLTFVGALRAFEQARPKPRKTVLKALEKRTQEAAAMMAEEAQQR